MVLCLLVIVQLLVVNVPSSIVASDALDVGDGEAIVKLEDRGCENVRWVSPERASRGAYRLSEDRTFEIRWAHSVEERENDMRIEIITELGSMGTVSLLARTATLMNLKLGTHWVSGRVLDPRNRRSCRLPRVLFDLVPDVDMMGPYLRPNDTLFGPIDAWANVFPDRKRPIRVALVGSLSNDGQGSLMLQQLRGLSEHPDRFHVTVMYSTFLGEPRPLLPQMEPFVRSGLVDVQTYGISIDRASLASFGSVDDLTRRLERARNLDELEPWQIEPIADLFRLFQRQDIVSFTHVPESDETNKFIVQAARLAGVPHILCEAGKWARSSIYVPDTGITGIVAPSSPACAHWMQPIRRDNLACHVVPPGVSVRDGNNNDSVSERSPLSYVHDGTVVIAWIGRFAPIKGPGLFVRVASLLVESHPHVKFVFRFIGDGPLMDPIVDLVERLGLSERFVFDGWIPSAEVLPTLRRDVDVVIHTTFEETFCITNVQGMTAGRPVVTFGTTGVAEYLKPVDVHGVVVSEPTPHAMATSVSFLLRHPEDARAIGRVAALAVRKRDLSVETTGRRYAALYEGLVGHDDR